jgi:hypothetical protein
MRGAARVVLLLLAAGDSSGFAPAPIGGPLRGGPRMSVTCVTFDIDGTICIADKVAKGVVANAMHRGAFEHAFKTVCGFEASIDEVCSMFDEADEA